MTEKPRASIDLAGISRQLIANVEQVVVGKRQQIAKLLVAWYCEGHVLLEDVPGVAKTILARAFARERQLHVSADSMHARSVADGCDGRLDLQSEDERV